MNYDLLKLTKILPVMQGKRTIDIFKEHYDRIDQEFQKSPKKLGKEELFQSKMNELSNLNQLFTEDDENPKNYLAQSRSQEVLFRTMSRVAPKRIEMKEAPIMRPTTSATNAIGNFVFKKKRLMLALPTSPKYNQASPSPTQYFSRTATQFSIVSPRFQTEFELAGHTASPKQIQQDPWPRTPKHPIVQKPKFRYKHNVRNINDEKIRDDLKIWGQKPQTAGNPKPFTAKPLTAGAPLDNSNMPNISIHKTLIKKQKQLSGIVHSQKSQMDSENKSPKINTLTFDSNYLTTHSTQASLEHSVHFPRAWKRKIHIEGAK
jgi:hypothetical protein